MRMVVEASRVERIESSMASLATLGPGEAAGDDDARAPKGLRPRLRLFNVRRNKTLSVEAMATMNEADAGLYHEQPGVDYERPRTRAECVNGIRPCPFVSCRHHLFLDVKVDGAVKMNFPGMDPEDMVTTDDAGEVVPLPTCSLDVADLGMSKLDEVGAFMNLTRERVRQVEVVVLRRIRASRLLAGFLGD